jgi:hypothetical protein
VHACMHVYGTLHGSFNPHCILAHACIMHHLLLLLINLLIMVVTAITTSSSSRPHIIFVVFDDLGHSDHTVFLSKDVVGYSTPHLDSLVKVNYSVKMMIENLKQTTTTNNNFNVYVIGKYSNRLIVTKMWIIQQHEKNILSSLKHTISCSFF